MTATPWDSTWHLRSELARVLGLLRQLLTRQRVRGRSPAGDAVGGLVIENGEAEGLLAELAADLEGTASAVAPVAPPGKPAAGIREEILSRATAGASAGADLPLLHAARAFELTDAEYDALLLALAVEHDPRFGRLIAYLNDHVARTRPTVGLAMALAGLERSDAPPFRMALRPIVRDGLVVLEGEGPGPGLTMRIAPEMLQRLGADDPAVPASVAVHPPASGLLGRLVLGDEVRQRGAGWVEVWRRDRRAPVLLLGGADGSGRTSVARALSSEIGLSLAVATVAGDRIAESLRSARREARWHRAGILVRVPADASALDWPQIWDELAEVSTPIFVAMPDDSISAALVTCPAPPMSIALTRPTAAERHELWRAVLPPGTAVADEDVARVAATFRLSPRAIAAAARHAQAALTNAPAGQRRLTRAVLEDACRATVASAIGGLAQRLALPYERRELIVPKEVDAELDLAIAWVRHERRVLDDWGFRRRVPLGRGLTALFSGSPGCGKTMGAQVLARELGLDLYRVDLSQIMSKYIGETEKNLARLFDHGESMLLFFDEADALFGKRSTVRDAHDRYANVEIGYLLQRLELHDGVTVLASNRMRDMDDAFIRRFHVIAEFPMPAEPDRLRIWEGMLATRESLSDDLDLPALARKFEISGGEIKNAALAAAFMAAAEQRTIGMADLTAAVRREMVKAGRVVQ